MHKASVILEALSDTGLMPLYYHPDPGICCQLLKAIYDGGARLVEYTNRGTMALENFRVMRSYADENLPGLLLGIGTIKDAKSAKLFLKGGADFVVSPGMDEVIGEMVHKAHRLWIPGCMTATEIMKAEAAGARIVKLFPGNILGPGFVRAVREVFPQMQFMPTGGVDTERTNLENWFSSGVIAVGLGGALLRKDLLADLNYSAITEEIKRVLEYIYDIKKSRK
ncbi:hypothetical protein [Flavihumibacter petaseus]|uniref:Putative 2-keto-3-deoxy-6-phosphogluconate/4-hydroxy-2-oxoglutarate aldolase n=1 Tax=Flavihumibacter petaseus NBRC 106054 TaxID=1220578 RepID=A0A0E9N4X0_9BACT|nr:hypothetical protein [Flavihumibacter petaseus]GAO44853.1 putative 2-keto-3-deoxy-6-phosphogluconate/4-hydroxy-2-oxoglutarate aldolase [Flavihumibacter petaseus NBRC 106054]